MSAPLFNPFRFMVSVCPLLTLVRFTVTELPETEVLATEPVPPAPGVAVMLLNVTGAAKVNTTLWLFELVP